MVINCSNISKSYRYFEKNEGFKASVKSLFFRKTLMRQAVKDFSFTMDEGEFIGLMGPNGAGKSTLVKVLTGIIDKSGGELTVLDRQPFGTDNDFKRQIAVVMGQKSQLWWDLPASDTLLMQKSIYGIEEGEYRKNVGELTELFDVTKLLNVPVRNLSLGERMKFELICALLHSPKLIFLDEPTIGLDASAQLQIRRLLKAAGRERHVSLLLTSHYTQDLLDLTPRVMVIRGGEKLYDGDLASLLHGMSRCRLVNVSLSGKPEIAFPDDMIIERAENKLSLRIPQSDVKDVLAALFSQGVVADLTVEDEDVTELVERLYLGGAGK
ncbi:MAG: ATP-binding cassette domain-containing protein [Eubacteriales bacterium]|nr:ATP-binding cassette domain-containing protein [Eubacteriales bacterium]MDD3881800.1 ATP-binding cassette domain-containing protein [Eubacteriales bacterium]MDD4513577.1 ATP-binding cassette domain-containing protein [Eubacteriales bacterium]